MKALVDFLEPYASSHDFVVGLSGGVDSMVLLHAMKQTSFRFRAIHVNHHLHEEAGKWQQHCEAITEAWNIPFSVIPIHPGRKTDHSLEAHWRRARYEAIASHLQENEYLLTAHHADDQLETLLMRLVKGTSLSGLRGILPQSCVYGTKVLRPLLSASRRELEAYANQHQLSWIHDDSNADVSYDRNFLRHEILPKLQARWPEASKAAYRTAARCEEANHFLQHTIQSLLQTSQGSQPNTLSLKRLRALSAFERYEVLKSFLQIPDGRLEHRHFVEIDRTFIFSRQDAKPIFTFAQRELHRRGDNLYLCNVRS